MVQSGKRLKSYFKEIEFLNNDNWRETMSLSIRSLINNTINDFKKAEKAFIEVNRRAVWFFDNTTTDKRIEILANVLFASLAASFTLGIFGALTGALGFSVTLGAIGGGYIAFLYFSRESSLWDGLKNATEKIYEHVANM